MKTIPDVEIYLYQGRDSSSVIPREHQRLPFPLRYQVKDYDELERIVNESKAILMNNQGLYNITTSLDEGTPEVEVAIDRFKTSYYNVTVESVINQIKSYLSGSAAGSFEKDGEMKDITIKLGDHFTSSASAIL